MLSAEDHVRLMLALMSLTGVGPVTTGALASTVEDMPAGPGELAEYLSNLEHKPRGFTGVAASALEAGFIAADRCIEQCREHGIGVAVERSSPFWPALWSIPKPPVVLYYRGDVSAAGRPAVAVIGTRHPTEWGRRSGERVAKRCCERGFAVVSGLAVGCDTAAHEGALAVGGASIAVLAHGLDSVYPAVNRGLAERLVEEGGLLVSEYPPGHELRPNQLVERDRLQAALSQAVIVVETDVKGGTMHTVGFAEKQGRRLAALVHPTTMLNLSQTLGNQALVRAQRATPLPDSAALTQFLDSLATGEPGGSPVPVKLKVNEREPSLFDNFD